MKKYTLFYLLLVCAVPGVMAMGTPVGIKGVLSPSGKAFTILWSTRSSNESEIGTILGYNVYRRASLTDTAQKINDEPLTLNVFADRVDGQIYYYSVRAVDEEGVETDDHELVDSALAANRYFFNADGDAYVRIPNTGGFVLEAPNNKFGVPLTATLADESVRVEGALIRQLSVRFVRSDTLEDVTQDVILGDDDSEIHIRYLLINGSVAKGSPAVSVRNTPVPTAYAPDDLIVYWNNGVSWIPLDSENKVLENELVVNTAQGGVFQVRALSAEDGLTLNPTDIYPKTITPNGDGLNDRVFFVMTNPQNVPLKGLVMDLAGRRVTELSFSNTGPSAGSTLIWSGMDDNGAVVPSGEYIYRINGGGRTYQGLVSVAR